MTKRINTLVVFLLVFGFTNAQAPNRFSYQAVVRNASNALLSNQTIGMRISILQGSATGTAVYVETHMVTTTVNGQVNLEIGGGNVLSGTMAGINWSNGSYFVKTEADPAGGTNYSLVGTSRLQSVPYAQHAATAGNGVGNGTAANQMMYWNGSAWVTLNPGSNGQVLTLCNGVLTWTTGGQCPASVTPCPPLNGFNPSITYGSMTDQEGNIYKTVTIGTQVWMAENLRTGRYRNGDLIPNVTNNSAWTGLTSGAVCWYNNDSSTNHCLHGRMYNWLAVADSRNICPPGWHVPSDAEFTALTNFLGGIMIAGGKMKSNSGWMNNGNGSNSSGFTGRPDGARRGDNGVFASNGYGGWWWSSSSKNSVDAWTRDLDSMDNETAVGWAIKVNGHSVRCMKD